MLEAVSLAAGDFPQGGMMGVTLRAVALLGLVALLFGSPAYGANAPFASLSGLTPPQRAMAAGIQTTCQALAPISATLSGATQDLFFRCREMVQTSNQLQGAGPPGFSLGLSTQGLAEVLDRVSHEQDTTKGTGAVETSSDQFRAVGARLAALRGGARGLSLGGLKFEVDGKIVTASRFFGIEEKGGGASADSGLLSRLGAFVNGNGGFGTRDGTDQALGFDFTTGGITAGADYRFTDNLIFGVAFNYLRTDADLNNLFGDVNTRGYGGSLYGTYYIGAFHLDVHGGFTWNKYDTKRNITYAAINRTATGSTDGQQYEADLGVGYDFHLGGFTLTPLGRAEYLNLSIESFRENGAQGLDLTVRGQRLQSVRTAVGLQVSYAFSVPFGVLVPQLRGEWRHEFKNDARSVTATYSNDPFGTAIVIPTEFPDRNYFALAAGISGAFARGISAFVNYETLLGLRDVTNHQFTGGVRFEF